MILASNSCRRQEILKELGFNFKIIVPNIEEISDKEKIEEKIMDIAYKKAMSIAKENPNDFVLAADTIVEIDNQILGKPKNEAEAKEYLKKISGKTHKVITAYSLIFLNQKINIKNYEISEVEFYELSNEEIDWYISTKEPLDKAGAYAVQGKGRIFVKNIKGDYFSIVGFPIAKFIRDLKKINYSIKDIQEL